MPRVIYSPHAEDDRARLAGERSPEPPASAGLSYSERASQSAGGGKSERSRQRVLAQGGRGVSPGRIARRECHVVDGRSRVHGLERPSYHRLSLRDRHSAAERLEQFKERRTH